jgi:DNA-binding LytR/AlgR family response regulator
MLNSLDKKYPFNNDLRANLKIIFGIGLGMFLFLLFFQPFVPRNPDFNNKLLILAGFGGITILLLYILRIFFPWIFPKVFVAGKWTFSKELFLGFLFLALNSVAFVFYARYVGGIKITFHTTIIIVIMSLVAVSVMININELKYLKSKIKQLTEKESDNEFLPTKEEEDIKIEFESENKSEYFHLFLSQIILIKSANNYIEVVYKQDKKVQHRLIRNTMKNAEMLFANYPSLIRCHRSCIVNKSYIEKISKGDSSLKLTMVDYPEIIHVSRQYILSVREALKER